VVENGEDSVESDEKNDKTAVAGQELSRQQSLTVFGPFSPAAVGCFIVTHHNTRAATVCWPSMMTPVSRA